MEDKEMQEIYNPQSGEKVIIAKKPFWREWRFWVYSVIAVLLLLVSVSSMATACAAINAGVGREEEQSSFVSRERKEAYYNPDYASYSSVPNTIWNYATPMKYKCEGESEYTDLELSRYAGLSGSYCVVGFITMSYRYMVPYTIEIYKNGVWYQEWTFTDLGDVSVSSAIRYSSGDYIWIFEHNPYYDGLTEGLTYVNDFDAVTSNHDQLVSFGALNSFQKDYDFSTSSWTIFGYDVCTYTQESDYRYLALWFLKAPGGTWFVHLTESGFFSSMTAADISANSIGYWNLRSEDPFAPGAFNAENWRIISVAGGVVVAVQNAFAMNNYVRFLKDGVAYDRYQIGYDDGKEAGYAQGYAVGRVDGANSVDPESLTNTLVAVFQQPFNQIYRFFNFNILGLNILGLATALISIFIIIKVVKKIL